MDSATDLWPDDLVRRIAVLLRSANPLRIGSAIRRADEILECVGPADRAAILDRAVHLALTGDEKLTGDR